jgi:hypothetical protein
MPPGLQQHSDVEKTDEKKQVKRTKKVAELDSLLGMEGLAGRTEGRRRVRNGSDWLKHGPVDSVEQVGPTSASHNGDASNYFTHDQGHPMSKTIAALAYMLAAVALVRAEGAPVQVRTARLKVGYDPATGHFSITSGEQARPFLKEGKLSGKKGTAKVAVVMDSIFGKGQAIEVRYPDGSSDQVLLFPDLPFVLFRSRLHNGGKKPTITDKVRLVRGVIDLGIPAGRLRTLGTGGLHEVAKSPGSYMWLALADPKSRKGVVAGWLTTARGSGVVFAGTEGERVRLDAQIDYGRLQLPAGRSETLETFALGYFDDARLGLESWADAVAKVHAIKLPPQPVGYCTWYHAGASNEKKLAEQTAFAAKHLKPFGFSFVQIDDGWQEGVKKNGPRKNFTTHRRNGPYPSGMKKAAEQIKEHGLTAGLWFMPFAGTFDDPWFKERKDWFVKREDGRPFDVKWGGTSLDMSHPAARKYVREMVRRMTHDWGSRYLKMDGLWTGSATEMRYINDTYKDDRIGNARFHSPDKTNIEVFRDGLRLVREAAGRDVFLLGCCAPQNMRSYGGAFGLLDAMRIGPDNKAQWPALLRGPLYGSRNYHLHGRVWYNDPDPLYVRRSLPLNEARLICSWLTISGQLSVSSDAYADLPEERLDLLKRTMPSHGLRPRPVDLFEEAIPRIWLLSDDRSGVRREVIGLFNWSDREARLEYDLERLGLSGRDEFVGFDYWSNALVSAFKGTLHATLPARSCAVWSVRRSSDHPQLLGTSRHITGGIVDVLAEKWDANARVLEGKSRVVGGDEYQLRIHAKKGKWKVAAVAVAEKDREAGVRVSFKEEGDLVRVTIRSAKSRDVRWKVRFREANCSGQTRLLLLLHGDMTLPRLTRARRSNSLVASLPLPCWWARTRCFPSEQPGRRQTPENCGRSEPARPASSPERSVWSSSRR